MSNPSTPFGFQWMEGIDGVSPNFGVKTVYLNPSTTSGAIYGGDVCGVIAGGYVNVAAEVGGGAPIGGIFLPCFQWQSKSRGDSIPQRAWLGNTADIVAGGTLTAKIVTHPNALFRARTNGSSAAAVTQANVGQNVNFAAGAGPGNNLISTFAIDDVTLGSGASLPFNIYALDQTPNNDVTALYDIVIVRFNNLAMI